MALDFTWRAARQAKDARQRLVELEHVAGLAEVAQGQPEGGEAPLVIPASAPLITGTGFGTVANLVLIVTDHADFRYDEIVRDSKMILDTRNATIGEICGVMREKWGEFQASTYV